MAIRYEYKDGKSEKFWEVFVDGFKVITTWGRIGADGQQNHKLCASDDEAVKAAEKLIIDKLKKGYQFISENGGAESELHLSAQTKLGSAPKTKKKANQKQKATSHPRFTVDVLLKLLESESTDELLRICETKQSVADLKKIVATQNPSKPKHWVEDEAFALRKLLVGGYVDSASKYTEYFAFDSAVSDALASDDVSAVVELLECCLLNVNGLNSYGNSPLISALETGSDDEIQRLVRIGADPRLNWWLYEAKHLQRITGLFGDEFAYPATDKRALEIRRTPNIRVAQELLRKKSRELSAECYQYPNSRSFEEYAQSDFTATEIDDIGLSKAIENVLRGAVTDVRELDHRQIVAGFYSTSWGGGPEFSLYDILSAVPCADCVADNDCGGMFWLITLSGEHGSFSRITFS